MVLCSFGRRTAFGTTYCNSIVRPRITPLAFQPIGLAIVGLVTDRFGPAPVFLVAGGLNAVLALFFLVTIRGIRDLD